MCLAAGSGRSPAAIGGRRRQRRCGRLQPLMRRAGCREAGRVHGAATGAGHAACRLAEAGEQHRAGIEIQHANAAVCCSGEQPA